MESLLQTDKDPGDRRRGPRRRRNRGVALAGFGALVSHLTDLINDSKALGPWPRLLQPILLSHWACAEEAGPCSARGLAGKESVSMFKRQREVNRVSQQETLGREQGLRARRMRQRRKAARETLLQLLN